MTVAKEDAKPSIIGLAPLGVRPTMRAYCQQIWQRRDFVLALPMSQLRSRNANTLLGSAWHLLNPLILAATYYLVFGVFLNARDDVGNYTAFLVTGLFVFFYTQKCLTSGASAIVANEGIIRNVNLPRAVFPLSSVVAESIVHVPTVFILVAMVVATGEQPQLSWLLLVPLIGVQALFNLGLSLWVGRLTFYFRDMQNLIPFAMRLWLYVSGIFFVADRVPAGSFRSAFEANPAYIFISLHRDLLIDGTMELAAFAAALTWSVALLLTGFFFFWRSEDSYGRG